MTKQELNRDIKRFRIKIEKMRQSENKNEWFEFIDGEAKQEFNRLFYADPSMQNISKQNIIIMLGLNVSHRFIPLHNFRPSKY